MTTPEALTAAKADLQAHAAAYEARRAHDARVREHAAGKPTPPSDPRPTKPEAPRPVASDVYDARATVDASKAAAGSIRTADAAVARARAELDAAIPAEVAAVAEAKRAPLLVAACKRAPGDEAAASLAAMGDTGDTRIEFAPENRGKNDPYVRITWRGVDFSDLSAGEKVLADLELRLGWQRATKLFALPVVVDDVQAWNAGAGPWPVVDGASVWLTTTDTP